MSAVLFEHCFHSTNEFCLIISDFPYHIFILAIEKNAVKTVRIFFSLSLALLFISASFMTTYIWNWCAQRRNLKQLLSNYNFNLRFYNYIWVYSPNCCRCCFFFTTFHWYRFFNCDPVSFPFFMCFAALIFSRGNGFARCAAIAFRPFNASFCWMCS